MGIKPGEKVQRELLPHGWAELKAARSTGTIDGFLGLLAGQSRKAATIEEMDEAWR